jgi:hypothetical protein
MLPVCHGGLHSQPVSVRRPHLHPLGSATHSPSRAPIQGTTAPPNHPALRASFTEPTSSHPYHPCCRYPAVPAAGAISAPAPTAASATPGLARGRMEGGSIVQCLTCPGTPKLCSACASVLHVGHDVKAIAGRVPLRFACSSNLDVLCPPVSPVDYQSARMAMIKQGVYRGMSLPGTVCVGLSPLPTPCPLPAPLCPGMGPRFGPGVSQPARRLCWALPPAWARCPALAGSMFRSRCGMD